MFYLYYLYATIALILQAVEQQIKSFGQTPAQLLVEPHSARQYRKVWIYIDIGIGIGIDIDIEIDI